jgi:hypothetical protein
MPVMTSPARPLQERDRMTITARLFPRNPGAGRPAALMAGLALSLTGCASAGVPAASAPASTAGAATSPASASSTPGAPAVTSRGTTACTLVTRQDASTALGAAVGPGKSATAQGGSRCVYGDGALIVSTDAQGKTAYDQGRAAMTSAPKGTWAVVRGLGDGAFVSHGGFVASVEFYQGATMVSVILSGSQPPPPTAAALAVARAAAARM